MTHDLIGPAERRTSRRNVLTGGAAIAGGGALALAASTAGRTAPMIQATPGTPAAGGTPTGSGEVYQQSPWWSYLSAHIENESPPDTLGGPIRTTLSQDGGGAFWVFPGKRELDPAVFGTPENPKGTEVPGIFLGVPEEMREIAEDGTYRTSVPTPFGDAFAALENGSVNATVVDATAIDGATTKDEIDFEATFPAPMDQGQYRVVVSQAAPHGWVYPTGGGVVHNVILHGVTGWGPRLFPTIFTYMAFWGPGDIYKDDQLVAEQRLIHVMLTEYARIEPYDQALDSEVNPNNRHLHLQVAPFTGKGEMSPVPTGFMLPNGMEQPFLHVMFPAIQTETSCG